MALTALQTRQIPGALQRLILYQGSDPAANTEFSETVPAGMHWELLAVFAQLVTDANAATRLPKLVIDDGSVAYGHAQCASAGQAASLTRQYTWAGAAAAFDVDTSRQAPLARYLIPAGGRIASVTTARQAGDNWGAPVFLVLESP